MFGGKKSQLQIFHEHKCRVRIRGSLSEPYKPTCGIHQGGYLSFKMHCFYKQTYVTPVYVQRFIGPLAPHRGTRMTSPQYVSLNVKLMRSWMLCTTTVVYGGMTLMLVRMAFWSLERVVTKPWRNSGVFLGNTSAVFINMY